MTQVKEVPMLLDGRDAAVVVIGSDLISREVLLMVGEIVDHKSWEKDPGIRSIVFRDDGFPVVVNDPTRMLLGVADPDAKAIVINLQRCFEEAVRISKESEACSVFSLYLMNMLATVAHEAYHLSSRVTVEEREASMAMTEAEQETEEKNADMFSLELLYGIAEEVRVEPGEWVNEPYFAKAIELEFASTAAEDEAWAKDQKHMLEKRLFFETADEMPLRLHNFRHFLMYHGKPDKVEKDWWDKYDAEPMPICDRIIDLTLRPNQTTTVPQTTPTTDAIDVEYSVVSNEPIVEYADSMEDDGFGYDDGEVVQPMPGGGQMTVGFGGGNATQYQPTPPTAPPVQQQAALPVTSMSNQDVAQVVAGLYMKLHNHIFAYCGFDGRGSFTAVDKVMEIPVQLDPAEMAVLIGYDCKDANGRWCPGCDPSNGLLRGFKGKETGLPMYKLYINFNGVQLVRLVMPQNPRNNSQTATAARNGSRITFVQEGNSSLVKSVEDRYKGRIVDNGGYVANRK
jgi:hypothetical protein